MKTTKKLLCLLITLIMIATPALPVFAVADAENLDSYLVAHWDFEEENIYTDNLTRVKDVGVGGAYNDLMSAQGGAEVKDGVGIVSKDAGNVFVSYHTSNLAEVTTFSGMTAVMKMKVDAITGTAGKDFFDVTKNNLYSIRCLFIPQSDGKSFKFQVTTLSTGAKCAGATWSSAWASTPAITLDADQWFYFALTHEFDSENHSVTTVYYSIDDGKTFTKYLSLTSSNVFTEAQLSEINAAPTLQNLTFGKYQWDSYPVQAQGYAFEDIRMYKTVLNESNLQKVAADVEESLKPAVTPEEPAKPAVNPDAHLVAHWDFEDANIYTDNLTRIKDVAVNGSYNDLMSAQGGATVKDGVGIVSKDASNVFASYHTSNLAKDVTNFAGMTVVMKMKVDAITGTTSGDFFDITKNNLYSIRCLFIPQSDGQSFKFQVTTLSTAANCGGATWSSAWAATPAITYGADQWFYFAMTHEFDSENHSVTTVYYSIDGGKTFTKYLTLVSTNVFTAEQIAAASTEAPTLQNLTFGKYQWNSYPAQAQGYAFDDIRIYNTVLDEAALVNVAEGVEAETRFIGYQLSKVYTNAASKNVYDIRLIGEISAVDLESAGFAVTATIGDTVLTWNAEDTTVYECYSSLLEGANGGTVSVYKANSGKYLIALNIRNIPEGTYPTFAVSTWANDGEATVTSVEKSFTVTAEQIPA